MRSIYINDSGDFEFNSMNEIKIVDGIEEIKQRLQISLVTEMKEWFLDLDFGVPWLQMLEVGDPPEEFRKEILQVLNADPAIDKINSIETNFDRDNRKLKIDFIVQVGTDIIAESVVIE